MKFRCRPHELSATFAHPASEEAARPHICEAMLPFQESSIRNKIVGGGGNMSQRTTAGRIHARETRALAAASKKISFARARIELLHAGAPARLDSRDGF